MSKPMCAVEVTRLYYSPEHFLQGEPEILEVEAVFEVGAVSRVRLRPDKMNSYFLYKEEPRFRGVKKIGEVLDEIERQYQAKLAHPEQHAGLCFRRSGSHQLPDGSWVSVIGGRLIGECRYPYIVDITDAGQVQMQPAEKPLTLLAGELLLVNPQVLLAIAYLMVTLVRSWVRGITDSWQAVLMVVGRQGMGKTTLAERITGWYQDGCGGNALFFGAGSTPASMRDILVNMRDLPVVIDDLCLSASPSVQRRARDLGAQFVREGANAAAITKKKPGCGTARLQCAAGLVMTAEFALENGSDITRCIYLTIDQPLGLPESLTTSMIGAAVQGFLNWFLPHQEQARAALEQMLKQPDHPEVHQRAWKNFIILKWGMTAFLCAAEDEGCPDACRAKLMERFNEALVASLQYQSSLLKKLDRCKKKGNIAAVILAGLEAGAFQMTKNIDKLWKKDGIWWRGDAGLRKDALERFIRLQDGYGTYTISKIIQELKDIGALVIQEEGTAQVKIKKGTPRVYRLRLDVLRDEAEEFKGGEEWKG